MSHIHIPDGVLPVTWWLAGYILVGLFLVIAVRKIDKGDLGKKIPYLGVVGAFMLITMSVPVGPLPFHVNLTILTGILAGPWLGILAILIVNLFLAFLGHGGITVVGINTLILGSEMLIGWGVYHGIGRFFNKSTAAGVATVVALLISTVLMLGVVGFSQAGWEYALPHDHDQGHEHEHIAENRVESGEEGIAPISVENEDHTLVAVADQHEREVNHGDSLREMLAEVSLFNISGFMAIGLILLSGIGLETLVTVLMVRFFKKVRPDLLEQK